MAIQRSDPLHDLVRLRESVNQMFEEALGRSSTNAEPAGGATWRPPVDLFEESGHYVLRVDLPGVPPSDVDVHIAGQNLVVRGERKPDSGVSHKAYLRIERPAGRFAAEIALPPSIDRQRIHANHRNGVLEIVLPTKTEQPAGRIEVASD